MPPPVDNNVKPDNSYNTADASLYENILRNPDNYKNVSSKLSGEVDHKTALIEKGLDYMIPGLHIATASEWKRRGYKIRDSEAPVLSLK